MRDLALPIMVSALLHGAVVVALPTVIDGPRLEQVSADAIEIVLAAGAPMAAQPVDEPRAHVDASVTDAARADLPPVAPRTAAPASAAPLVASDLASPRRPMASAAPGAAPDAPARPEPIVEPATAAHVDPVVVPTSDLPSDPSPSDPSPGGALRGDRRAAVIPGANPAPTYPPLARRRGVEGTVIVRAQVRRDGTCDQVVIARTSGSTLLDRAARRAVARWRFEPARRRGEPVPDWLEVPVEFHLIDSD